jgi:DNA replication initiation complex subunit (GINS family)
MEEIKITLETLYDILRNEKKREELQPLEATFLIDVVSYMREKQTLLTEKVESNELFAAGAREKLDYELKSIKRILKEIYEKREKKIIDIAINKSRTGSDIIDTGSMLREEKAFYEETLGTLDKFRVGVIAKLFKGELPLILSSQPLVEPLTKISKSSKDPPAETISPSKSALSEDPEKPIDMTKVKFIHPMPSFVWKDMKVYGPYDKGQEIDIFPEVADLLVRKNRAEKV